MNSHFKIRLVILLSITAECFALARGVSFRESRKIGSQVKSALKTIPVNQTTENR